MNNRMKSLSEIFLDELNGDYSDDSVGAALQKCDGILRKEIGELDTLEFTKYFFDEKEDTLVLNDKGIELFDFWDVFREFIDVLRRRRFEPDLIIIITVLEVDNLNKQIENENTKNLLSEEYKKNIQEVKEFLIDLEGIKVIKLREYIDGKFMGADYPMDTMLDNEVLRDVFLENLIIKIVGKIATMEVEFNSGEIICIFLTEKEWRVSKIEK